MEDGYEIRVEEKIGDPIWGAIGGGIHDFNEQQAGGSHGKSLCFVLYDPQGAIAGGLIGETHWDWLYVNLLFLKDELRGQGYGRRLMELAEAEARQRGARHAYLDTFSFQAPVFYEKLGYAVFGELQDFPVGHQRYFMRKDL